jgi:hypothetical protein
MLLPSQKWRRQVLNKMVWTCEEIDFGFVTFRVPFKIAHVI